MKIFGKNYVGITDHQKIQGLQHTKIGKIGFFCSAAHLIFKMERFVHEG